MGIGCPVFTHYYYQVYDGGIWKVWFNIDCIWGDDFWEFEKPVSPFFSFLPPNFTN